MQKLHYTAPTCVSTLIEPVCLQRPGNQLTVWQCYCRGGGAAEMFGVADEVDIHIGTLSKGFGSHGGFVAGSSLLKSFLMNKGRSYVFSTALPLPAVAAAQAAIHVCHQV